MNYKYWIKRLDMKNNMLLIGFIGLMSLNACFNPKNEKTSLEIMDNGRHYYPIQTGQDLDVVFKVKNIGKSPLIITDIITSCGCIVLNKNTTKTIPAGQEGFISMTYNSTKNVGFVKHWIELYGNFEKLEKMELVFDVNVVPDAMYTKDYEELFLMEKEKNGNIEDLVDGTANNKGYYMRFDEEQTK